MPVTKAESNKKTYNKRKKLGLCTRCGAKKKKTDKYAYCEDCRAAFRKYGRANSDEIQKKRRKEYKLRKKQRVCTRCGKKLSKTYPKTRCQACLDQSKIYEKKRREQMARKKAKKTTRKTTRKTTAKKGRKKNRQKVNREPVHRILNKQTSPLRAYGRWLS